MIYELRAYRVTPGRLEEVLDNAVRHAIPLQERHGFDLVGFWTPHEADDHDEFDLVYLLRWKTMSDREDKWRRFANDPDWIARRSQTDSHQPLIASETIRFLDPTVFSALQ